MTTEGRAQKRLSFCFFRFSFFVFHWAPSFVLTSRMSVDTYFGPSRTDHFCNCTVTIDPTNHNVGNSEPEPQWELGTDPIVRSACFNFERGRFGRKWPSQLESYNTSGLNQILVCSICTSSSSLLLSNCELLPSSAMLWEKQARTHHRFPLLHILYMNLGELQWQESVQPNRITTSSSKRENCFGKYKLFCDKNII